MFEYISNQQSTEIRCLREAIVERMAEALKAAWESGRDLVKIREYLGYGKFTRWLRSDEWGCSQSWAYRLIHIYEGGETYDLSTAINDDVLCISPSAFLEILKPQNQSTLKVIQEQITNNNSVVTIDKIALRKIKKDISFQYSQEPNTGCYDCKKYKIHPGGRRFCEFFYQRLNQLPHINPQIGCENLQSISNPETIKNSIDLPEVAWTKLTTCASKAGVTPETFVTRLILKSTDQIEELQRKVEELEAERRTLILQNNAYLTQINNQAARIS